MRIIELDFTKGKEYRRLSDDSIWVADGDDLLRETEDGEVFIDEWLTLKEIAESNFELIVMPFKKIALEDNDPFLCPHCGSDESEFIPKNDLKGVEKYLCNSCSKTYTVLYQFRMYDILES